MASALETLCGQAYGAKQHHMLGIYMQRSWLILLGFSVLLAPTYIFSAQLLVAVGLPAELSHEAGLVSVYFLPLHFISAVMLPLNKFLQCQLKNWVMAVTTAAVLPVHVAATWLLVRHFELGVLGAAMAVDISWGLIMGLQLAYAVGGGCPETWRGFSALAFVDLKDFVKLSAASGVMVWYVICVNLNSAWSVQCISLDSCTIVGSWPWTMEILKNDFFYDNALLLLQLGDLVLPAIGFPHRVHEERGISCGCTLHLVDPSSQNYESQLYYLVQLTS
jgi:MATE family multidrug resistance protein